MWLGREGLDAVEADLLAKAGVDELALRVGEVDLAGNVPVVKLYPEASVGGELPVAIVVRLTSLRPKLDPNAAIPVWGVLQDSLGEARHPAGIVLDLPLVNESLAAFVANLAQVARVPVVPLVTSKQLRDPQVLRVIAAAGHCSVLAYGAVGRERSRAELSNLSLADQLAPLAATLVRPRIAFVLRPRTQPPLLRWTKDLDSLTDPMVAKMSTQSPLDRSFTFRRAVTWSGRPWKDGDTVALRWMDVSRLDAGLHEAETVAMPEVVGWDLVTLPPQGDAVGISREALLRYLRGEGPGFEPKVEVGRRGRTLRVTLSNPSPFGSAVSAYGSWVQVAVERGALVATDRGGFDRIMLGTLRSERSGQWQRLDGGAADAVRFYETYLAPEERVVTGTIRLPSSRSHLHVSWRILLSTGRELEGTVH